MRQQEEVDKASKHAAPGCCRRVVEREMTRPHSRWAYRLLCLWSTHKAVVVGGAASFAAAPPGSRRSSCVVAGGRQNQQQGRRWGDATSPVILPAARSLRSRNGKSPVYRILAESSTALYAAKKSSSKKPTRKGGGGAAAKASSSSLTGFGGAAAEPCSCGSTLAYNKCCGRLHRDPLAFASARPSEVVRARYTAYAKRVVDFIVASTHPLHPTFGGDVEHWKRTIETNCYDNFLLNSCVILEEADVDEGDDNDATKAATVKFLAKMTHRDTGERTAFVETSTFLRDSETGAWLYRDGVIESPEDQVAATEERAVES
jgi:SEC-C motif domain protein